MTVQIYDPAGVQVNRLQLFLTLREREREREREATEIQADKIYKSSILHMGICGNETLQKSIKRLSLINPIFNIFELIIWYHI